MADRSRDGGQDEQDDMETLPGRQTPRRPVPPSGPVPEAEPPTAESDPGEPVPGPDDEVSIVRRPSRPPRLAPRPSELPGLSRPGPVRPAPGRDEEDEKRTMIEGAAGASPPESPIEPSATDFGRGRDVRTAVAGAGGLTEHAPPRRPGGSADPDDEETLATGVGASSTGGPRTGGRGADVEDEATVADAGLTDRQKALFTGQADALDAGTPGGGASPTHADPGAPSATERSRGPVPASKFSRGTARDPVGGTAAGRGTVPGARAAPAMLKEGELLADRYELVRRLGKGGMGEVWQAKHTLLQGMRAIKVIKASISRDEAFRARFLSEGQTMMRVKHPGVVEVTDLDETRQNRELFMVMEYLKGRTVYDAVRDAASPLGTDVRNVMRIFRDLALGMQRIHDERIVHKDLKTDNVLLVTGEDGLEHPKVIDFGLAKRLDGEGDVPAEKGAAHAGHGSDGDLQTTLSGTLAYMSPEQFRGEPSSFQSDIYAFGVMLYETFMKGEYPMPRGGLADYMKRHTGGEVPKRLRQARPDLAPEVASIADRCMAPQRADRPESFRQVADEIQWWLDAPVRAARRKRMLLTAGAALGLVGIAVWGVFFSGESLAGLTGPRLSVSGAALEARDGVIHMNPAALANLDFEAGLSSGGVKGPLLEIDGVRREAAFEVKDGRVRAEDIDLSALSDGEHTLVFRSGPGAPEVDVRIRADRAPPSVDRVALSDREGLVTNQPAPVLLAALGEPHAAVRAVWAVVGAEKIDATRVEGDDHLWSVALAGLAQDGEHKARLFAEDLAGNRTAGREFAFVRDTAKPQATVDAGADLVGDVLQIRSASGGRFAVLSSETADISVSFGGEPVRFPAARRADVEVPETPSERSVAVNVRDAAGNTTERTFTVRRVRDAAAVTTADGRASLAVRGGEVQLLVSRTYPLPAGFRVTLSPERDAAGAPAADAPRVVDAAVDPVSATQHRVRFAAPPQGAWRVTVAGLDGAEDVAPLSLVVDPAPPVFASVRVADAGGREIPAGGWGTTRRVTVTAEVADLSLASVTLGGRPPREPVAPGRGTYTFDVSLGDDEQGRAVTWSLAAADLAENTHSAPVTVQCDWTDPTIQLTSPAPGARLNDVTSAAFEGVCSESAYKLVVEGIPGVEVRVDRSSREFRELRQLPRGRHAASVYAVDPSGRKSAPVTVELDVEHVVTEKPDRVTWRKGVDADMVKVTAGNEVIGGRTQPVGLVYLDRHEVTNAMYRAFLADCAKHGARAPWDHPKQPAGWSHVPPKETWNDPKWNADDLPVVNVAWWDAYAFAAWTGRRLPTEAEWVKAAARSKDPSELELRRWPPLARTAAWKDGLLVVSDGTRLTGPASAVKGDDESPSGCLHMGGNVSEWVDTPFAQEDARTGVRGGNWFLGRAAADVSAAPTMPYEPSLRAATIGFRCAVDEKDVP